MFSEPEHLIACGSYQYSLFPNGKIYQYLSTNEIQLSILHASSQRLCKFFFLFYLVLMQKNIKRVCFSGTVKSKSPAPWKAITFNSYLIRPFFVLMSVPKHLLCAIHLPSFLFFFFFKQCASNSCLNAQLNPNSATSTTAGEVMSLRELSWL